MTNTVWLPMRPPRKDQVPVCDPSMGTGPLEQRWVPAMIGLGDSLGMPPGQMFLLSAQEEMPSVGNVCFDLSSGLLEAGVTGELMYWRLSDANRYPFFMCHNRSPWVCKLKTGLPIGSAIFE